MIVNCNELESAALYKLMTSIVVPRPIGWISTKSLNNIDNLAPFSFFNMISYDPPHVVFAPITSNDKKKDTALNIIATGEFVVNFVTEDIVELMNQTAMELPFEESEFDFANIESLPSIFVKPKRVKASPIQLECKMVFHHTIEGKNKGGATLIVGKVLAIHIDDKLIDENLKIDQNKYHAVGKLGGGLYSKTRDPFYLKRITKE